MLTETLVRLAKIRTRVNAGRETYNDLSYLLTRVEDLENIRIATEGRLDEQKERIRELEGEAALLRAALEPLSKDILRPRLIQQLFFTQEDAERTEQALSTNAGELGAAAIAAAKAWAEDPEHDQALMDAVNALVEGDANE